MAMSDLPPQISSFILRFVQTGSAQDNPLYRGTIRHIQSGEEMSFARWREAETFIQRFVPIQDGLVDGDAG